MTKSEVVNALRAELEHALEVIEASARDAHAAATHPDAKPENDKDTRSVESSYLAGAQAQRAMELSRAMETLASIPVSDDGPDGPVRALSLVTLEDEASGQTQRVLVSPAGAGVTLETPDGKVQVVTTRSPIGAALMGQEVGAEVVVDLGGRKRTLSVVAVA